MRFFRPISAICLLCLPFMAPAQSVLQVSDAAPKVLQFYASDKTAEALYDVEGSVFGFNNSRAYTSFLFSEERDLVLQGSILYDTDLQFLDGLTLMFGSKVSAGLLGDEDEDIIALGVNIEAGYVLPLSRFPLDLTGGISYAPDILTFGQSDRVIDYFFRAGLPLNDTIDAFVGFRFLQFDTRPGDEEVDKRVHIGVRYALGN